MKFPLNLKSVAILYISHRMHRLSHKQNDAQVIYGCFCVDLHQRFSFSVPTFVLPKIGDWFSALVLYNFSVPWCHLKLVTSYIFEFNERKYCFVRSNFQTSRTEIVIFHFDKCHSRFVILSATEQKGKFFQKNIGKAAAKTLLRLAWLKFKFLLQGIQRACQHM